MAGLAIIAAAATLHACRDATTTVHASRPHGALALSEPISSAHVSPAGPIASARHAAGAGPVVFMSLAPGAVTEGTAATVTNVTTGLGVETVLRAGGLDPVPVAASVGDSITVSIPVTSGPARVLGAAVPASTPPTVVRTVPAANATGVPRNQRIVIVFSEPLLASAVGPASLRLLQGGATVAGTVAFLDSSHVTAVYTPAAQLDADTRFELIVSAGLQDLDGDTLGEDLVVDFTTGRGVLGPVAAVAVYPTTITVPSGRMVQFTALPTDAAGDTLDGEPVRWVAGDSTVATLSDFGINLGIMVRGGAAGSTTITATSDAVSGTAHVGVAAALPQLSFAQVSAGFEHTCGVTTAGAVYCWGSNLNGELGNGSFTGSPYPGAVAGGPVAASVGTGYWRSCALTSAGAPWCWGDSGLTNIITLGTGASVPVQVPGSPVLASMVVGGSHACGLTSAGQAYCWGANSAGQLGDGTNSGSNTPRAVIGGLHFSVLAAGTSHTCGLSADSLAYCWGWNALGNLGNGSNVANPMPAPVLGTLHFAALSAGYGHTCGVTASGALYCWGANGHGELGAASAQTCPGQADAVATDACSLTPLRVEGIGPVRLVAAGDVHTCALTTSGATYCWGDNTYAQLGSGTTANSSTPVAVSGGLLFATLGSGGYHTCGITTAGIAYCWGFNTSGQLGDGTTQSRTMPVRVAGQ